MPPVRPYTSARDGVMEASKNGERRESEARRDWDVNQTRVQFATLQCGKGIKWLKEGVTKGVTGKNLPSTLHFFVLFFFFFVLKVFPLFSSVQGRWI